MILPIGAQTFVEAMRMGSETYHHLKVAFGAYIAVLSLSCLVEMWEADTHLKENTLSFMQAVIKEKYGIDACNVGDEGGFAPNISR